MISRTQIATVCYYIRLCSLGKGHGIAVVTENLYYHLKESKGNVTVVQLLSNLLTNTKHNIQQTRILYDSMLSSTFTAFIANYTFFVLVCLLGAQVPPIISKCIVVSAGLGPNSILDRVTMYGS